MEIWRKNFHKLSHRAASMVENGTTADSGPVGSGTHRYGDYCFSIWLNVSQNQAISPCHVSFHDMPRPLCDNFRKENLTIWALNSQPQGREPSALTTTPSATSLFLSLSHTHTQKWIRSCQFIGHASFVVKSRSPQCH